MENTSPNKIFSVYESGSYEFINCTVGSDQFDNIASNKFNTVSLTPESEFINALKLLNTGNCYGTYDIIGSLIPDIPTPEQTPHATKNLFAKTCKLKSTFKNIIYLTQFLYSRSSLKTHNI